MNFEFKTTQVTENDVFKILGRKCIIDGVPHYSWSNAGLEFMAEFLRITFHFADYECEEPCFVKIYVDGSECKHCISGKNPSVVLEGFKNTVHRVTVRRITEGNLLLSIKSIDIYGKNPEFLPYTPQQFNMKIEFLGDSITAGYGTCAPCTEPKYYTHHQDSTQSYAFLTAKKLNADIRTECISGQGINHSCGEMVGVRMKEILKKLRRGSNQEYVVEQDWIPDVFVVNAGTNDRKKDMTDKEFIDGSIELLELIRQMYPACHIVWVYGLMEHAFEEQVNKASEIYAQGDNNFSSLILDSVYGNNQFRGTCGHPNADSSEKTAKILAKHILKQINH